jgi:hypothetical protein
MKKIRMFLVWVTEKAAKKAKIIFWICLGVLAVSLVSLHASLPRNLVIAAFLFSLIGCILTFGAFGSQPPFGEFGRQWQPQENLK